MSRTGRATPSHGNQMWPPPKPAYDRSYAIGWVTVAIMGWTSSAVVFTMPMLTTTYFVLGLVLAAGSLVLTVLAGNVYRRVFRKKSRRRR